MESDGLIQRSSPPSNGDRKQRSHNKLSNWVLVVAVSLLAGALIVDIRLRLGVSRSNNDDDDDVSAKSTTTGGVIIAKEVVTDDTTSAKAVSSPPPRRRRRYHATQFVSFTINTLGGLAKHGECEGRSIDPDSNSCYLGNSDDIESDVNHRLSILEEVLSILR